MTGRRTAAATLPPPARPTASYGTPDTGRATPGGTGSTLTWTRPIVRALAPLVALVANVVLVREVVVEVRVRRDGELEPELGAALGSRRGPDAPVHRLDELAADEQPDPGAGRGPRCLRPAVEQVEEPLAMLGRDADPFVEDAQPDGSITRIDDHPNRRSGRSVLGRVRQEVADDRLDVRVLAEYRRKAGRCLDDELSR